MRTLLKLLLVLIAGTVVTRLAARVVSKQFEEGSEVSDEFRRMVIFDGLDFASRARGLRQAEVGVVLVAPGSICATPSSTPRAPRSCSRTRSAAWS